MSTTATGMSLSYVETKLIPIVTSSHQAVKAKIEGMAGNEGDIKSMLEMQMEMATYTTLTELTSSVIKQVKDTCNSIVQKS